MSEREKELSKMFSELENIYRRELDPNSETDGKWDAKIGIVDQTLSYGWDPINAKNIDEMKEFTVIETRKIEFKRK